MLKAKEIKDEDFINESEQYFKRNYSLNNLPTKPNSYLKKVFRYISNPNEKNKVLEIGCGCGNNLKWIQDTYNMECYGCEPGNHIKKLNEMYDNISFYQCSASLLPFENSYFDIVILRSVLHWVDRNFILQSIGEAIRVSKNYIIISDFCPKQKFKTPCKHQSGLFTYHTDYEKILTNVGLHDIIYTDIVNENDEYNRIKTQVYQVNQNKIPIKTGKNA